MKTIDQIQHIIEASSLTNEQMALWEDLLTYIEEDEIENILTLLKANSENLVALTKNLQAKNDALATEDVSIWEQLMQQDVELVSAM